MTTFPFLPVNVTIVTESDRTLDGNYTIGGDQIFAFEFEILADGQIKINSLQYKDLRQSLSIRAWVSILPVDIQLFNHFHPGSGGIHHLFVDETITPRPEPQVFQIQRNQFSSFEYAVGEILVALPAGVYYYNIHNMEGHENGFKINLVVPACC